MLPPPDRWLVFRSENVDNRSLWECYLDTSAPDAANAVELATRTRGAGIYAVVEHDLWIPFEARIVVERSDQGPP